VIPVANSPQARKRARQNEKARAQNQSARAMLRTHLKRVVKALDAGDAQGARSAYERAVPVIDRIADKDLIHKNTAARRKSRLNARLKALQGAGGAAGA
jgi:small subunit ribosomal protein S20